MTNNTVTRKNLKTLKGTAHAQDSYFLTAADFMNSSTFRKERSKALILSVSTMTTGFLLPLMLGFVTALPDFGTDYFQISVMSNAMLATVFSLPLSIALIGISLPLYHRRIRKTLERYGFIRTVTTINSAA